MRKLNPMWSGRFSAPSSDLLQQINQSVTFDQRLATQDILGSKAHCKMLAKTGIISKAEAEKISDGLNTIAEQIKDGKFNFKIELEDIHMNIEAALSELIGETAGKLHTARSRNDQVATDFKLWVRDALDSLDKHLDTLQKVLHVRAEENTATILPGFTHLQAAQPITFAHHLRAYFEMFKRDRSRIFDARKRLNECPLGAAALAGTSFPIDREFTAQELGFLRPTANSMDSVSDRDFALEYLSLVAILAIHLSRLAEEMVIWSTAQFAFIRLDDSFTTGSSIMPQKRNPDAAELIRAKSGRIIGNLNALLIALKGLPLAYSKDMQEDKEPVFDSHDTIELALQAMSGMLETMQVNKDNMYKATAAGYLTATDLADWLVQNFHIPFRKAHSISGQIVKLAENKNCQLTELTLEEMQSVEPQITQEIFSALTIEAAVKRRNSLGGTGEI